MRIGQRASEMAGTMGPPLGYDDEISLGDRMRGERATLGKSLLDVQRELKIKAAYIAAIENADLSAFESPGFIAGYVRSYARYLGLEPDRAFASFCAESGFRPAHGMAGAAASGRRRPSPQAPVTLSAERDIFADRTMPYAPPGDAMLSRIEPGAVGSLAVLVALIGAVGWGGWSVLQEVQRVTLAPVNDTPGLVSDIDPLAPVGDALAEAAPGEMGPPSSDALDRLYRPRALDVPVLVARDGPIAALDPGSVGGEAAGDTPAEEAALEVARAPGIGRDEVAATTQARSAEGEGAIDGAVTAALSGADGAAPAEMQGPMLPEADDAVQVVAGPGEEVVLVAVRPSWVRVRAADGTVVLEKILETGETYPVARTEVPATLRTGNAGAVYFSFGGKTFGPAGEGPTVVSDIPLTPEAVTGGFAVADLEGDPDLARMVRVAEATPGPTPGAASSLAAPSLAAAEATGPADPAAIPAAIPEPTPEVGAAAGIAAGSAD